jgi:hypothetical protein
MKLKYLFLPGSVSLFVLLQFLQEAAISEDGIKVSYLSLLRWGIQDSVSADAPIRTALADGQYQFGLLLSITVFLLGPPLVWSLVVSYKHWRSEGKENTKRDDEPSREALQLGD